MHDSSLRFGHVSGGWLLQSLAFASRVRPFATVAVRPSRLPSAVGLAAATIALSVRPVASLALGAALLARSLLLPTRLATPARTTTFAYILRLNNVVDIIFRLDFVPCDCYLDLCQRASKPEYAGFARRDDPNVDVF